MRADIDLRSRVGSHVLDQGYRPTCVAFAASCAHEARQDIGSEPAHFAPEALWWQATTAGLTSVDGMVLDDVGDALSVYGQPDLAVWPYDPNLRGATEGPPAVVVPPWRRARLRAVPLQHYRVEESIEDELALSHTVVLVVEVADEFYVPGPGGIVRVPDVRAGAGGCHAVTCVGAATHPALGRLLLIKNSWGAPGESVAIAGSRCSTPLGSSFRRPLLTSCRN